MPGFKDKIMSENWYNPDYRGLRTILFYSPFLSCPVTQSYSSTSKTFWNTSYLLSLPICLLKLSVFSSYGSLLRPLPAPSLPYNPISNPSPPWSISHTATRIHRCTQFTLLSGCNPPGSMSNLSDESWSFFITHEVPFSSVSPALQIH